MVGADANRRESRFSVNTFSYCFDFLSHIWKDKKTVKKEDKRS